MTKNKGNTKVNQQRWSKDAQKRLDLKNKSNYAKRGKKR